MVNELRETSTLVKAGMLPEKLCWVPMGEPSRSILILTDFKVSVPLFLKVIVGLITESHSVIPVRGLSTAVNAASIFTFAKSGVTFAHHVA